ncbi:MAG: universal stress protein [Selenomonadaceae bacterium]|nr:universal stress protein [Selenomonadaceae bacterium]
MPYEKVCIMVAMVISVVLSVLLSGNFSKDAPVAVIDLDNSRYSRELINKIDASEYMKVTSIINSPVNPEILCYRDQVIAVVYLPQELEKNRYSGDAAPIGVFYDNTNTAQTADIKGALNEIVAIENAIASGSSSSSGLSLNTRNLFNPSGSTSNATTQGFLFFFGAMFFTFATIGMVPRLRLSNRYERMLLNGTPFDLIGRLTPYVFCLVVSMFLGLAVLRVWGDLVFSGRLIEFLIIELLMAITIGMLSVFMGWTAANPGIASSRMILFIPGGFIFGGVTSPLDHLSSWVVSLAHIFPLTWQFHFTRDIIQRGASLTSITAEVGEFLFYIGIVAILFSLRFEKSRAEILSNVPAEEKVSEIEKPAEKKLQHILVPTDGSGQAFKAALEAVKLAENHNAQITLLTCVEMDKEISAFEQVSLSGYIPAELNAAAYNLLSELMEEIIPRSLRAKIRVEIGDPGESIVDVANYEQCDTIIMGAQGFGSFNKEGLGSVASYVKENAECPVILVEGLPEEWAENKFKPAKI